MKRLFTLVAFLSFTISGCSYYSCPTYASTDNNGGTDCGKEEVMAQL